MKQCKCGSFAFNLAQDGIDQCDLCDRHYWQDRAEKAEKNIEACRESLEDSRDDVSEVLQLRKELAGYKRYDDEIKVIEAQLARHDEALDAIAAHRGQYSELAAQCSESRPQCSELEKDAARYRWLRSRDLDSIVDGGVFAGMVPDNVVLNGDDLDAAIDAAIAKDAP